jgi:hypothetical protein
MFGPKSGLRLTAVALAASLSVVLPLSAAQAASDTYSTTVKFLADKFVEGKALDGFTPGKPDYGFTLEAMLQRKAGGQKLTDQIVAVKAVLADSTVASKSVIATYAYSAEKLIKPGLAGKFLFVSAVIGVPNAPLRNSVIADLKKAIGNDGSIASVAGNSFDYAWVVLGLSVNGQTKLANLVANQLASIERPDGGFGMDQTGDTTKSSADATGIAMQALALAKRTSTKTQITHQQSALVSAAKYLRSSAVSSDHWESWGDVDVNGTAYAAMGLKAAGANITAVQTWLKTRVAPQGGLTTPWSNGAGDVFATAQGYVPLLGLSYLNLIPAKK